MATTLQAIITRARLTLLETTPSFWSDAELLAHGNAAIKDLWKAIVDLYQDHIVTMDISSMSLAANTQTVSGVPANLFRIVMIQPRVIGESNTNPGLVFQPRRLIDPDFVQAQAMRAVEPRHRVIFYAVINAGAPVAAPAIVVAPLVSSDVPLAVWFNPVIADVLIAGDNPIPGESDKAIEEWIIAYARAKERDDRSPDTEHLNVYATEKRNLITVLTPRSVQEPDVVHGMWQPAGAQRGGSEDWGG